MNLTCFLGQPPIRGQLTHSETYGRITPEATLVVLGCSGPGLCERDAIKAFEQQGKQVIALLGVGIKDNPGNPSSANDALQVERLLREFHDLFSEELGLIKGPFVKLRVCAKGPYPVF